jgi:type IV secretory pathway VirB10-like protein
MNDSASAKAIDMRHDAWKVRLPPQGARLIGIYDSQVAFGQSRVLLVWTRLIMPNGRSIVLERQPRRRPRRRR